MIASFFQSLKAHEVEYLLISGQAAVLHGAATFSEDIDLWIQPVPANAENFLRALHTQHARYYKLTPPWELSYLCRGHGFHFVLAGDGVEEVFLDVMGVPPRVSSFERAAASSIWLEADWGLIHTIGIPDLVELKKTQRMEDYPIISNLVLRHLGQPNLEASPELWLWAVNNLFTLSALTAFFEQHPQAVASVGGNVPGAVIDFGQQVLAQGQPDPENEEAVQQWMQQRASGFQKADRDYWRPIIQELRALRTQGKLTREAEPV
jgi:hypothetical protein